MKKTILIVEDESHIREDLEKVLRMQDYNTLSAPDGKIAFELAKQLLPDLIISDIMMPVMNGYELLEELRQYPETLNIPFLFISAKSERADIREGMKLGADDYLTKPFDFEEIIEAVESRFRRREIDTIFHDKRFDELRSSISRSLPHEIRTPLNIILGFSDYLLKSFDPTKQKEMKEMLTHIYSSAKRLNKLFEKYLLYAHIEIIASDPAELLKLLSQKTPSARSTIIDITLSLAAEHGRRSDIHFEIEDAAIKISQEYFSKIIEEMVDNAFKYSKPGTPILISSYFEGKKFFVSIADNGRGMTPKQIENIGAYIQFERRIYEQQGIGLGITLAKRLTELHKGEFSIDSLPDSYTKVIIGLPYEDS